MKYPNARIQIFCKAPEPGAVKTRLLPALGAVGAARLHQSLAEYCIRTAVEAGLAPVELWCAPHTAHPFFARCAERYGVSLHPQRGCDLGARMCSAAAAALRHGQGVLIIGTDCPALTPSDLEGALDVLSKGTQAVLGPAEDGGYVLLGLREEARELFTGIAWGSSQVLDQTRARLRRLDWQWQELRTLWDVDRPADYHRLCSEGVIPGVASTP